MKKGSLLIASIFTLTVALPYSVYSQPNPAIGGLGAANEAGVRKNCEDHCGTTDVTLTNCGAISAPSSIARCTCTCNSAPSPKPAPSFGPSFGFDPRDPRNR